MSKIRVRYSTIINYASQAYRLLVALGFSVVVIRKLTVADYGLWATAASLYGSLWSVSFLWSFWASRSYARGDKRAAELSLMLDMVFAAAGGAAMVAAGLAYSSSVEKALPVFAAIALMLMPVDALYTFSRTIVPSVKPESLGYSAFIFETLRLPLAYAAIVVLRLGVVGLVAALALSEAVAVAYLFISARRLSVPLAPRLHRSLLRSWVARGYVPALQSAAGFVHGLDRPLLTALSGSAEPSAFLGVASLPRRFMVQGSVSAAWGVYARMLREPSAKAVGEAAKILLLLNLWATGLLLAFSKPVLSLLNPAYSSAWTLLDLMALESLLYSMWSLMRAAAIGAERADSPGGGDVRRSALTRIPAALLARNLAVVALASTASLAVGRGPVSAALPFALLWFLSALPLLAHAYKEAASITGFRFPARELIAFSASAGLMVAYAALSNSWSIEVLKFWEDAPLLVLHILASSLIYAGAALTLSSWLRSLVREGLREARRSLRAP